MPVIALADKIEVEPKAVQMHLLARARARRRPAGCAVLSM